MPPDPVIYFAADWLLSVPGAVLQLTRARALPSPVPWGCGNVVLWDEEGRQSDCPSGLPGRHSIPFSAEGFFGGCGGSGEGLEREVGIFRVLQQFAELYWFIC